MLVGSSQLFKMMGGALHVCDIFFLVTKMVQAPDFTGALTLEDNFKRLRILAVKNRVQFEEAVSNGMNFCVFFGSYNYSSNRAGLVLP